MTYTKFTIITCYYYLHKVHSYYLLLLLWPTQSSQLLPIIIITCTKFTVMICYCYLHKVHSYYLLLPKQSSQSVYILINYTKFTVLPSFLLQKRTCSIALRFRINPKQKANWNMEQWTVVMFLTIVMTHLDMQYNTKRICNVRTRRQKKSSK